MFYQGWSCLSLATVLFGMLLMSDSVRAQNIRMKRDHGKHSMVRRQQPDFNYVNSIATIQNPNDAINAVLGLPGVGDSSQSWAKPENGLLNPNTDDGDSTQVVWFSDVPFTQPPNNDGYADGNWKSIPDYISTQALNFTLNTTFAVTDQQSSDVPGQPVVQPFYVNQNYDPTKIKRALIVFPGKPRDSWKYATLFSNALNAILTKQLYNIKPEEVLIIAPAVLNTDDKDASDSQDGSLGDNWLIYKGSNWESGGSSKAPTLNNSITFYSMLDRFATELMNQTKYPQLKNLCEAQYQGGTHLQRGAYFASAVGIAHGDNMLPPTHNVSFIAGVSHQDYPMIAATQSLDFLFGQDYDKPRQDTFGIHKTRPPKTPSNSPSDGDEEEDWESSTYRTVAWVVLVVIIVILIVGFFAFDRIFKPNTLDWDRDYWEATDAKQRLL
ncbi:hypothetical protein MVES_000687 [Malassezia vespertilionis]|uniref:Uncharacterized protein n=1 Tax=Malassezia vespertilionis TaxID=2020962 RepID=A0A2N1JFW9_9BASI|nr:hypothetical protein MVES_000687 [Malassezia vespertilionis]